MPGVDIGAVVAAAIGAVGGGLVTAAGGLARSRGSARTAARLIYAELTRNGASVAYFRLTGTWPVTSLAHTAWDRYGKSLAQMRRGTAFDAVYRGYAALEAVQYIASGTDIAEPQRSSLLDNAVQQLTAALRATGEVAHIPRDRLDEEVKRLSGHRVAEPAPGSRALSGAVPPFVLTGIIDHGSIEVQLTASRSQLPAEVLRHSELPIARVQASAEGMRFAIYDADHGISLDAVRLVRSAGDQPTGDQAVDETYDAIVTTWTFVREILGRESLSGTQEQLSAVVHYGHDFNNAFWNGQLVVVGDGDGKIFRRFSGCLDILAHELFHAVPGIGALQFRGQSGSLVESMCDVFGSLVLQYSRGQAVSEASWILGENLFAENVHGLGLRSLRTPGTAYDDKVLGKDPQVGRMDDLVETKADNGGVHINCGIPSQAFYRLASALGGHAWERAGLIWFDAATADVSATRLTFAGFASRTIAAARERYGPGSPELRATEDSWEAVGVKPHRPARAPGAASR